MSSGVCLLLLGRSESSIQFHQSLREKWSPLRRLGRRASFHQGHHSKVRNYPVFPSPFIPNLPLEKRYDYQAHKNNAIIIPCCGFDSVPADVVVYLANKTAKSALGPSAYIEDSISLYNLKGGFSGGTLASAISSVEDVPNTLAVEAMKDFSYRERERVSCPTSVTKLTQEHCYSKRGSYKTYEIDIQRSGRRKDLVWCSLPHVLHKPARSAPYVVALQEVPGSTSR